MPFGIAGIFDKEGLDNWIKDMGINACGYKIYKIGKEFKIDNGKLVEVK